MASENIVFTIGHSNRTTREFMKILKEFDIEILADIRHYPGSRHNPHFGKARLRANILRNGIEYIHLVELGGRRRHLKDVETNAGWRSKAFRGYADYMQTEDFHEGMAKLMFLAEGASVAIMCSEAVPWRCHRSMVADALIVNGFSVVDLFNEKNARPHTLTSFAKVAKHNLTYPAYQNET